MVKIALISDSHGYMDHKILNFLQDVDEIWHAGDIGNPAVLQNFPLDKTRRFVFGNIDDAATRLIFPEELIFTVEGVKVFMTHIGGKPPVYARGIKKKLKLLKPDLFICGHSHICKVEFDPNIKTLYMNPGAIGKQGFHVIRTMLKFEINAGKLENLRVMELGGRGEVIK